MRIWSVEHRHLTLAKFPFRIFGQRMGVSVNVGVSVGVQYLGEGVCTGLMSVVSRDGQVSRGCAMRSLSPARCRFARCLVGVSCRVCSLNGGVSYKACHRRRAMSPCPVEYSCIPGCSDVSNVVPVD